MKIISLRALGILAAALIVVDAGSFYQTDATYAGLGQGYILAALVELFLAITISIRLKGFLNNLIICSLTLFLFLLAVTASTVTMALPAWEKINNIQTNDQMVDVLADGLAQEKQNATYMRNNKQSTNLAIAVKSQRKERAKLVDMLSTSSETELRYWVHFFIAIGLKLTLQLTNLWLFWLAGYYQRQLVTEKTVKVSTVTEKALTDEPEALTETVKALTLNGKALTEEPEALTEKGVALTPEKEALTDKAEALTPTVKALTEEPEALTETVQPLTPKTVVLSPKAIMKKLSLTPKIIADELGISRSIVSIVVNHYPPVMKHLLQQEKA